MELKSRDDYIQYLKAVQEKESLDKLFEVAAELLITKDHRIRNLEQAITIYKGIAEECRKSKD